MTTLSVNLHHPKDAEVGSSDGHFWVDVAKDNATFSIFVRTKEKANAIAAAFNMKEPNT